PPQAPRPPRQPRTRKPPTRADNPSVADPARSWWLSGSLSPAEGGRWPIVPPRTWSTAHRPRWGAGRSGGKDDLAGVGSVDHGGEALGGAGQREHPVDQRAGAGLLEETEQPAELVPGSHGRPDNRQLGEEHPVQLGRRDLAAGGAGDDDAAAGL